MLFIDSKKYSYNVISDPTTKVKPSKSLYKPSFVYQPAYEETLKPYKYSYQVKDEHHGTDFEASESSDGQKVEGHYAVLLPDGRRQRVEYTADDYNGYKADVSYEGAAAVYHISRFNDSPRNDGTEMITKSFSKPTVKPVLPEIKYAKTTPAPLPKTETNVVEVEKPLKQDKLSKRRYGYKILNQNSRLSSYPTLYHFKV